MRARNGGPHKTLKTQQQAHRIVHGNAVGKQNSNTTLFEGNPPKDARKASETNQSRLDQCQGSQHVTHSVARPTGEQQYGDGNAVTLPLQVGRGDERRRSLGVLATLTYDRSTPTRCTKRRLMVVQETVRGCRQLRLARSHRLTPCQLA